MGCGDQTHSILLCLVLGDHGVYSVTCLPKLFSRKNSLRVSAFVWRARRLREAIGSSLATRNLQGCVRLALLLFACGITSHSQSETRFRFVGVPSPPSASLAVALHFWSRVHHSAQLCHCLRSSRRHSVSLASTRIPRSVPAALGPQLHVTTTQASGKRFTA